MNNNENVKFNNGKDYACVSIKDEHIYVIGFELENVKRGDVIQVVRIALNNEFDFSVAAPYLVVDSDFSRSAKDALDIGK